MSIKLSTCPHCKNTPKLEDLTTILDVQENSMKVHVDGIIFNEGDLLSFTIKCPTCELFIYSSVANQHNEDANEKLIHENVIDEWNQLGYVEMDKCPKCKNTVDRDEYEFAYPKERGLTNDPKEVIKWNVMCDAEGVGCGFGINYKAPRNKGRKNGEELWNMLYLK